MVQKILRVLDLFSGLGGFSEAFLRAGHDVVRLDNNSMMIDIEGTQIYDVTKVLQDDSHAQMWGSFDVILASPPCLDFSLAYSAPRPRAEREGRTYFPDLTCLESAIRFDEILKPTYFIVENVAGSIKYFRPYLGDFRQKIGPFVLYGRCPQIVMPYDWHHSKYDGDLPHGHPLRANHRGKIPLEVSKAVLDAVSSPTLGGWVGI